MSSSYKKILVTGGCGFLGSHLCEKLISENNYIYCLDNLFTGQIENITNLQNKDNFEYINHDINNPLDIKVDEIFNLACPASPLHYQYDPVKTIKTCVQGSLNMLELAKKNNAKILQASTSEVYGDPLEHPQKESYWGNVNPIGPRSCYDEGKRCAETLFFDFKREYNLKIKVIRIFNTYGPRLNINDGRVVSNFILQALKNKDITIFGNGKQTRSFCYVDDLIEGLNDFFYIDDNFAGPINIGNPKEYTILELAKKIILLTKSKSKIIYNNLPTDDPKKRNPNIDLIKKKTGWTPKIDIETGLIKTINYFKSKL